MDGFSEQYQDLLEGSYDCVDRVVLNAYFGMGHDGGGMRVWWRALYGSEDKLDTAHLMRLAGRLSRRLRACCKAQGIPVIDCDRKEKKFEIATQHLGRHDGRPGLFLVLVSRAPAIVWEVEQTSTGKVGNIRRKKPLPFVSHYSFHIWDPEWGHLIIKMSGHPPFDCQIILNGHEYVACGAQQQKIEFRKEGNCFVEVSDQAGLAAVADTLSQEATAGRLQQVCDRWIYTTCLIFALSRDEQERSRFHFEYATYQLEYSRNLRFQLGAQMEQVLQALIDRSRAPLRLEQVKTIFGFKYRPRCKRRRENPTRWGVVVETPTYDLTVFKVYYGKLTLKVYSKGERVLRIEVMVDNVRDLPYRRWLVDFPKIVRRLKESLERFLNALQGVAACFIADDTLEKLPEASQVGQTRVGGVDFNRLRMRRVTQAVLALSTAPMGFTASELSAKVQALGGIEQGDYGPRQAAYDLKKLRGKEMVCKRGQSHRYEATAEGVRNLTALWVLRDKVIKPLLAAACQLKRGRPPHCRTRLDQHYHTLQHDMRNLFQEFGITP